MGALLAAVLLAGVPVPPECEAPPLRDVTPLRVLAQKSGALSVGHDSVATWCFDSQGAWTGGQANRKPDPAATPSGDCAKAIAACEAARADIGEPLKQLLVDALADLDRPFRGQKYVSKRSGLGERPADAADCRSKDRSVLFALAQARMDLARLASMAQSEYGVYRTWVMTEGYRCAQEVRARPDLTRLTVSRDAPMPAQEGSGIAGVANGGTGSAGGGSTIATGGSTAATGAAGPGTTTAAGGTGQVANGGSTGVSVQPGGATASGPTIGAGTVAGGAASVDSSGKSPAAGGAGPGSTTAATGSGKVANVDSSGKSPAAGVAGPGSTTAATGPGKVANVDSSGKGAAVGAAGPGSTTLATGSGKVANVDSSGKGAAVGAAGPGSTTAAAGSGTATATSGAGKNVGGSATTGAGRSGAAAGSGTATETSGAGKTVSGGSSTGAGGSSAAAGAVGAGSATATSGLEKSVGGSSATDSAGSAPAEDRMQVYGGKGGAVGLVMTRSPGAADGTSTSGSGTEGQSAPGTSPNVIVAAAGTFPGTPALQSAQRTDAGTLVVVLNAPVVAPGPVLPAKVPAAVTGPRGGAAAAREAVLERWHGLADRRAACEADRDYTLGFLASHELAGCRCERVAPSMVLARLEASDPKMEAAEEKAHVCEDCTQAAYDAWKVRVTKQCALIEKLSDYEVEVLTRSLDGQGLPPRCFDVVRARRPAGRTTTAAAPTSTDPRFVITRADAGVAPAAPAQAVVTSPVADTFLKAQEWAPVPLREDGRLYVRLFMSSACRAEILPGPIEARTGDLLLIPWGARRLSVRSSCGGLAEVYWGQEARPRVSEIFARSEPLVLEFKPQ